MKKLTIDFVIPIYNEEKILEENVLKLRQYLKNNEKNKWAIIIADNGSFDRTPEIGKKISEEYNSISYVHINEKGRGYALREAWKNSQADICFYMDVDLSTGLGVIQETILNIKKGYDMVIGSRYQKCSKVKRSIHRSILSKGYNILVQLLFRTKVKDMQCGFKAVNQRIIKQVLPKIKDNEWFFDTEIVLIAEREDYKIKEIPIKWTGNPNTKVNILRTIINYLVSLIKLKVRMKNETITY